jgi:hypothetical protein
LSTTVGRPITIGLASLLVDHDLHRPQHALFFALGEHDARLAARRDRALRDRKDRLHERAGVIDELLQLVAIGADVGQRTRRDAARHRRERDRRCDARDQPRIERLWNQVLRTETDDAGAIGRGHHVALLLARQIGDRMHSRDLHLGRDRGGTDVQRTAKDERKAQHVVDLVRIVGAAGGDHGVVTHCLHLFRHDLRDRIGERHHQRPRRHARHHRGLEYPGCRQTEKDVGAVDDVGQGPRVRGLREARLVLVHQYRASLIDDALDVGDPDVLARQPQFDQQLQAGKRGRARAARDKLDLRQFFADHLEAVDDRSTDDDRRAVLVIVEHRNPHAFAQLALHIEALGRLDVFQVDAAEGRLERGDHLDQLVGVELVDFDVEHVDAGELLEQHRLAFHHRLGRKRTDIAEAEHRGAVGDDADQIATCGVAEDAGRIRIDRAAGRRHARRVGERQIALVGQLLGGRDRNLSRRRLLVVIECSAAEIGFIGSGHCGHRSRASADYPRPAARGGRRRRNARVWASRSGLTC